MPTAVEAGRLFDRAAARMNPRWDPVVIGIVAFLVSVIGAGRPSFWEDESATISAATRPLPDLWQLLHHIDAVHGLYYLLMHGWFAVVPADEFWARLPSSVAAGAAAAGVVVLGRQLGTRALALCASIVFIVLPRTTWLGTEARSYALSTLLAVWLTVWCVIAARRDRPMLWAGYAVGVIVLTVLNAFACFIVLPHAVLVAGLARRRLVPGWLVAVLVAIVASAPFAWVVQGQKGQVSWIWPIGPGTIGQFIGDQYFPAVYSSPYRADPLAGEQVTSEQVNATLHAWLLVAPLLVVLLVIAVIGIRRRRTATEYIGAQTRLVGRTAAVWVLGPTLMLVLYSLVRDPIYQPHYLTYTTPGLALLIGIAVVLVGRTPGRTAIVLVVLALAAVPDYLAQRGPYPKFGMDYSQVTAYLAGQARDGDCLLIDTDAWAKTVVPLMSSDPQAFAQLIDPGKTRTAVQAEALYEQRLPVTAWADRLDGCATLWTITDRDLALPDVQQGAALAPGDTFADRPAYRVPTAHRFHIVERRQFNLTQVLKSVR